MKLKLTISFNSLIPIHFFSWIKCSVLHLLSIINLRKHMLSICILRKLGFSKGQFSLEIKGRSFGKLRNLKRKEESAKRKGVV
jgi:hypothetical protein